MAELIPPDLTGLDRVALSWFLLAWLGYSLAIHAIPWGGSITTRMTDVRRAWMRTMLARDNRITDASLIGHTVHSATFFASTTMVALAALLGMLGAEAALRALPGGSRQDPTRTFLSEMHELGVRTAAGWLADNLDAVGRRSSLDLSQFAGAVSDTNTGNRAA